MSRVEDASERLQAALDRLEKTLEAQLGAGGGKGGNPPAPLEEARHRNQELSDVADQAAQRLDRAVGRINAILES
jgi:hypothetical protein